MIRKNFYITEQQQKFMEDIQKEQGMRISEQIRLALDIYIQRIIKLRKNSVTNSPSKYERPQSSAT